jgi:hypothetical protein
LIISTLSVFSQQTAVMDPRSISVPRYTNLASIQSAILSPQVGMLVYNNATSSYWFYDGTNWQSIPTSSSNSPWLASGNNIYNNNIGNIGIGTSTPFSKLDILHGGGIGINVKSSSSVSTIDIDGASGGAELRLIHSGNLKWKLDNIPTSNNFEIFEFGASNVQRLLLQSGTGNLGIGQSNPSSKVDILHSGGSGLRVKSTSSFSTIDIDGSSGESALRYYANGTQMWNLRNSSLNNNLELYENGGFLRLTVQDATGNVGINEDNPLATLHVKTTQSGNTTAIFQGTNVNSSFNRGPLESTFINGGLSNSESHINYQASGNVSIANGGGKVGIGINSVAANERMEVNGRLRLRKETFTSGLWLNNAVNGTAITDGAFMGLSNDVAGSEKVGFWLNGNYRWEVDRAGNTTQNSVSATNLVGSGKRSVLADANGKLTTTGLSEIYVLSPFDFTPSNNTQVYNRGQNFFEAIDGSGSISAPVHLPNGSKLVNVTFYFRDTDPDINLKFDFYSISLTNTSQTVYNYHQSFTTSGTPGLNDSGILTISNPDVYNSQNNLYISVSPVDNSNLLSSWPTILSILQNRSLQIKAVKITYSF